MDRMTAAVIDPAGFVMPGFRWAPACSAGA